MGNKITKIKGFKYSKKEFDGYKFKAKFEFDIRGEKIGTKMVACIDIYTDNPNREDVTNEIISKTTDKVVSVELINWTTKEQDDLTAKFIEETLNKL